MQILSKIIRLDVVTRIEIIKISRDICIPFYFSIFLTSCKTDWIYEYWIYKLLKIS